MREAIQHILMQDDRLRDSIWLFYRSTSGIVQRDENGIGKLMFPGLITVDFLTYFNSVSVAKWKEYTGCRDLKLHLHIQGKFHLLIMSARMDKLLPEKTVLYNVSYDLPEAEWIEVDIPDTDDTLVSFYLDTETQVILHEGYYSAEFESTREVNLSLSTTTMKKEEYVTENIRKLHDTLLMSENEISRHLFLHVVDNGRTLSREDFPEHPQIFLHPNKNVGGAGGFARGMIESLEQKEKITHVLLMDDDVRMEPDSIFRTYVLLRHLLPDYQRHFISGAMLKMEECSIQQEDVGFVNEHGYFVPLKPGFNQDALWDNLTNSREYKRLPRSYAAWWYCCIPAETIRENGLPVPIFVRGDDVEYGLRCKPEFITMNGICVWHLGFAGKFNAAMDFYQVDRNMLINRAFGLLDGVDVFKKYRHECEDFLVRFDYDSAELVIRAMEDYLKGPEFIMEDHGEEILQSNLKLVHKMVSMNDLGSPDADEPEKNVYGDYGMTERTRKWFYRTMNGHRFWPFSYDRKPVLVSYNVAYTPGRYAFREKLYAFNAINRTGYVLERDNKRFKELWKRYKAADKAIQARDAELKKRYQNAKPKMITMEFWKNYLKAEGIYE